MRKIRIFAGLLFGLMSYEAVCAISLQRAEKLALLQAPELKQLNEQQTAYEHLSIGQSQWRDPELEIGLMNIPTDTFRFNQENMTQFKVGLKQMLPKGDSLKFKRIINQLKAKSMQSQTRLKKLDILKALRSVWVERFYWRQVRTLLLKQQTTFSHLIDVTESLYANNKVQQKELLNARMQSSKVQAQLIEANRAYQTTTIALARWLGDKVANHTHPKAMPSFQKLPVLLKQNQQLLRHPLILKDGEQVEEKKATSDLIKEDFKPEVSLAMSYSDRANLPNGNHRADFVSFGLNVSLPVNTKAHQSQNYQAALSELSGSIYQKQSDLNMLKEVLNDAYVKWLSFQDKAHIYRSKIIPQAKAYAEASLISYQNAKLDFPTLANGYVELYRLEIQHEQLRLMQAKQKINLLYLNGR